MQEVKIAPSDEKGKRAFEDAANNDQGGRETPECDAGEKEVRDVKYKAFFSLPRDKHNARGLGGKGKVHGVCTLIRDDVLPMQETKEAPWDLEGRVLITEFLRLKLVVINGYWVNGTMNPYRDPESGEVVGTRHDRKRAFHSSMVEEVKAWERKGCGVVLVGDMNVAPQALDGYPGIRSGAEHVRNRRDFNEKFLDVENKEGMRGIDVWRYLRGTERGYTYHGENEEEWGRSCDRVDLAIVNQGIVGHLMTMTIWEDVVNRGGSDHCPVTLWVDFTRLGGDSRE